jgi:acetyl esterase
MALDPESQRLLDLMAAANRPAWITLTPSRRASSTSRPAPARRARCRPASPSSTAAFRADRTDPVRLYRPASVAGRRALPGLVFAHGGGWVFGNLDSHDVLCAQLALEAGITVMAVDYRLAPECALPRRLRRRGGGLAWAGKRRPGGIDKSRLAIGGDSAGGNLAAAAAIWARDHGGRSSACRCSPIR